MVTSSSSNSTHPISPKRSEASWMDRTVYGTCSVSYGFGTFKTQAHLCGVLSNCFILLFWLMAEM